MPAGRPSKLTKAQRAEVLDAFEKYVARSPDSTIVGFCAWDPVATKYHILKDDIFHWEEFSELRKVAIQKQEAYLLEGASRNQLNTTMAIFRLKQPQHGYTDKQQTDITTAGKELPTPILSMPHVLPDNSDKPTADA